MNVERCIKLHNEILLHGWVNSGHDLSQFETFAKPWMSYFGDDELEVLPDLVPELQQFLQEARVVFEDPDKCGGEFSFFFWVDNLAAPGNMFEYEDSWEMMLDSDYDDEPLRCEYEANRFIVLYSLNQLASHVVGLVYDQKSHLCILCPDLEDMERTILKRTKWYPLDVVLNYWLSTIRDGRIIAVPDKHPESRLEDRNGFHPWRHLAFNNGMLDETLDVFNKLVGAIETRLPRQGSTYNDPIECGLVDADVLQLHDMPPGFARQFLERARTPRFKYVAPGLEVMSTLRFSKQPFLPNPDGTAEEDEVPAILLFYSNLDYDTSQDLLEPGGIGPFGYPYRHITTFPAGLYLAPTGWYLSDDTCQFVLPFDVGGDGYARSPDGALYQKHSPRGSFKSLYIPGSHPFETVVEQSLVGVLRNWLEMVERGDWKIDENGVAGGIDIWNEADAEEHWEKYVIKQNFG